MFGGGASPASSGVALERNFLEYRAWLEERARAGMRTTPHVFHFGSGRDSSQFDVAETSAELSDETRLFARVIQGGRLDPTLRFRHNSIPDLAGPATALTLVEALRAQLTRLGANGRGRFLYTGHGIPGGPRHAPFSRNAMTLWEGSVDAPAFAGLLDGMQKGSRHLSVLTQCHSGGFADSITWSSGRVGSGMPRTRACAFFSQRAERPAAGCSADLAHRDEYTVAFVAALRGRTLAGARVDADFNADGRITAREAHGHVVGSLESIDVPFATSDRFLEVVATDAVGKWRAPRNWSRSAFDVGFDPWEKAVAKLLRARLVVGPSTGSSMEPGYLRRIAVRGRELARALRAAETKAVAAAERLDEIVWDMQEELARRDPVFAVPLSIHHGTGLLPSAETLSRARERFQSHPRKDELVRADAAARETESELLRVTHEAAAWERYERLLKSSLARRLLAGEGPRMREAAGPRARAAMHARIVACEDEAWID
jgi:hypothetical protein